MNLASLSLGILPDLGQWCLPVLCFFCYVMYPSLSYIFVTMLYLIKCSNTEGLVDLVIGEMVWEECRLDSYMKV